MGFPGGSDGKESARNAGDLGLIPGLGRSPREGNGYPLQYSCLENSMDRGKEQGKRDEVAYVEVFILLHQEKESQRATIFRHGDLRENPVGYLDKRA